MNVRVHLFACVGEVHDPVRDKKRVVSVFQQDDSSSVSRFVRTLFLGTANNDDVF